MTDYCTVSNVQSRFKKITFKSNTSVTKSDVEDFIKIYSSEIDSSLEKRYQTPITGTNALNICRLICELKVTADILEILPQGLRDQPAKNALEISKNYRKMANQLLDDYSGGKKTLSDAVRQGDVFYSYNVENNKEGYFKKGEDQW